MYILSLVLLSILHRILLEIPLYYSSHGGPKQNQIMTGDVSVCLTELYYLDRDHAGAINLETERIQCPI